MIIEFAKNFMEFLIWILFYTLFKLLEKETEKERYLSQIHLDI